MDKFCQKCGNKLDGTDNFCTHCGVKIDDVKLNPKRTEKINKSISDSDGKTMLHKLTGYSTKKKNKFSKRFLDEANRKGITEDELEEICKKILEEIEPHNLKGNDVKDMLESYLEKEYSKNLNKFFSLIRNGCPCEIKTKREKTIYRERKLGTEGGGLKEAAVWGPLASYKGRITYEEGEHTRFAVMPEIVHVWEFEKCTVYFFENYFTFFDNQIFYKDITHLELDDDEIIVVSNDKWKRTFRTPTDKWISDEKTRLVYKSGFYNILNEKGQNIPHWFLYGGEKETTIEGNACEDKDKEPISIFEIINFNGVEKETSSNNKPNELNDEDMGVGSDNESGELKDVDIAETHHDIGSDEYKRKCPKCGKALNDDFEFCPYCGYKIEKRACPKCLTIYEDDFTHCPKCGLRLCTSEEFDEIVALTKKAHESYENADYQGAIDILKTQLEYYPNPEDILFLLETAIIV